MKTSELTGAALDWAVAVAEGHAPFTNFDGDVFFETPLVIVEANYSTNWSQGGPIIERENIALDSPAVKHEPWAAEMDGAFGVAKGVGPTPLTAAMRCYVASKLGNNVDIPEELC